MSKASDRIAALRGIAGIRDTSYARQMASSMGLGNVASTLDPNVRVSGQQSIQAGLALAESRMLKASEHMSRVMAQRISARSQELVPYDTGSLSDSHYCRPLTSTEAGSETPVWTRGTAPGRTPSGGRYMREVLLWEVGYDTAKAPHAIIVHENPPQTRLGDRPMTIKPPKEDHFLQKARDQEGQHYPEIAREELVKEVMQVYPTAQAPDRGALGGPVGAPRLRRG